ncbi:hypothetical protein JKP88DRAFT_271269 [Tribonema minus]|uniref:RRM domain-containing protein n=1 Tax=Tribonema minus TaxID=303371 RepID=A0A835ZDG4_9STRA|nr:hypothetical protein JKP88DRAFT_271269 [Tribonema minus]
MASTENNTGPAAAEDAAPQAAAAAAAAATEEAAVAEQSAQAAAAPAAAAAVATNMWFYVGPEGQRLGPLPCKAMVELLKKGKLHPSALGWTEGQGEWQPLANLEPFKDAVQVAAAAAGQWSYIDHAGATIGPMGAKELIKAFQEGALDGMTLVWAVNMTDWLPMAELPGLKELLMSAEEEENENGDSAQPESASAAQQQGVQAPQPAVAGVDANAMVFAFEPEEQPALDAEASEALAKARKARGEEGKKSFVTDAGVRYVWDAEENDWVEAGSEDEGDEEGEEGEEEGDEEPLWKIKLKKKREAQKAALIKAKADKKAAKREGKAGVEGEEEGDGAGKRKADSGNGDAEPKPKKARKKKKNTWSAEGSGRWVYIQGLPADITEEEMRDHFAKAGVIATDPISQAPRIKIYRDDTGGCKGDGSVCYVMEESVELALHVLDGSQIRAGGKHSVNFKSYFNSFLGLKPTIRFTVARAAAKQALSWNESDDIGVAKGGLKIVVIENMFDPSDFVEDPDFGEDLQADIALECQKLGPLEKITVFSRNPIGPVVVKFGTAFASEQCIKKMDGRWFGKRKLRCHYWDGITNYEVKEDASKEQERLDEFGDWLENQDLPEEMQLRTE